ncbi:hypothetical protein PV10_00032 [Exophiala mesophila]|uniref:Isochorismatase-like domain-containing protein n=1 Tax=Exophiala mesophila TaxID=212818 RepID=A0A0D2AB24_EXOME|nr:uncharacterized protein PV10_00032 [Exophiala mesophila]KIV96128.1 hypothetical protein PV10_00032 [Exophiala mesophila]
MSSSQLSRATLCPTALLLIDIQVGLNVGNGFYGTERSTPDFEANIASLLTEVRKYNRTSPEVPVVVAHVYHKSSNPESPLYPNSSVHPGGSEFQPVARPDMASPHESIFSKTKHSAFISTTLESLIRSKNVQQLIIVGITTDHCVSTTARMASDIELVSDGGLVIVSDATAAFNKVGIDADMVHRVSLASLNNEFAQVMNTRQVLDKLFGPQS